MPPKPPSKLRVFLLCGALALPSLAVQAARPAQSASPPAARELMTATLAGEYALQAGRLEEAARWYLDAARAAPGDAGLAERAARIALLADDTTRAGQAIALWGDRAPSSLAQRAAQATLLLRRGDLAQAQQRLQALMATPGEDGWRHALGALLSGNKDPRRNAQVLDALVTAHAIPDRLQPWLAFGGLAQRLDQPALAERIVARLVQRFPDDPRVVLLRAGQLRDAGKRDAALAVLQALETQAQVSDDLRLSIASEYDRLGEPARAAALLAKAGQTPRLYRMRAALLARAKDKVALAALFDELRKAGSDSDPDPERRLLLGQTAEFLERYPDALTWYEGVAGGSERELARLRIASVLHAMQRRDEAFRSLRTLQSDATVDEQTRRDAYLLEAELQAKDDPASPAELDAFARGLAAFPDEEALLYGRALAWERRDDIARAEADLRRILVGDPDNVNALNALGYTLADRTRRYAEALQLIDRARVAEPDNGAIIDSYGWVLHRLGRTAEALVELKRAYALQKDPDIAAHLGEVLWALGRKDEARRYFDEARKLDPDNRSLKRALDAIGA